MIYQLAPSLDASPPWFRACFIVFCFAASFGCLFWARCIHREYVQQIKWRPYPMDTFSIGSLAVIGICLPIVGVAYICKPWPSA